MSIDMLSAFHKASSGGVAAIPYWEIALRLIKKAAVAGPMAAAALILSAAPALAAGNLDVNQGGARSYGTVSFSDRYTFDITSFHLLDERCDSSSVYVTVSTNYNTVVTRTNNSGCGSNVTLPNVHWYSSAGRPSWVKFHVCVDSIGGDECRDGYYYNPYSRHK